MLNTMSIDYCNINERDVMGFLSSKISGNKKIFPGGLVCYVDGKIIPPFVNCSSSDGIISQILINSLKNIDKYLDLDRTVATPSLKIDGRGSQFEETFLSYINPMSNNDGRKWKVML